MEEICSDHNFFCEIKLFVNKICYANVNCRMKIKWADNSKDFFIILQDHKDLVEVNC